MKLEAKLTFSKETKNTYRWDAVGDPADHKIGAIYLKKRQVGANPPATIKVTVEEA